MKSVRYNVKWPPHKVNPLITLDSLYTLFIHRFEKGYAFYGETHDFFECVYVISGEISVTADERVFTLGSGGIVFHKPLELHKLSVDADCGADILVFTFDATGVLVKELENKALTLGAFGREIAESLCKYVWEVCRDTLVVRKNHRMISAHPCFDTNPEVLQMVSLYLTQLILSLSGKESQYAAAESESAMLFSRAVDYMSENIGASVSLADVAKHISLSESGVKRIFKRYANMGVHRYFLLMKIQAATRLLKGGIPVAEVAERLGFSSQGYFSACYKRETGRSPSSVR